MMRFSKFEEERKQFFIQPFLSQNLKRDTKVLSEQEKLDLKFSEFKKRIQ